MNERVSSTSEASTEQAPSQERRRTPTSTSEQAIGDTRSADLPPVGNAALARLLGPGDPGAGPLPPEVLLALQGGAGNREVAALMSVPPGEAEAQRTETPVQAPTSDRVSGTPPEAAVDQQGAAAMRSLDAAAARPVSATAAVPSGVERGPAPAVPAPVAVAVSADPALALRDAALASAEQATDDLAALAATTPGAVTFAAGDAAAEAGALVSEFLASIGARAAALSATGTALAAEYRATAEAATGRIRAAAQERTLAVTGHVAQLVTAAQSNAVGASVAVAARRDAARAAVAAATAGARERLEAGYRNSLAVVDARLATHLAEIDAKYAAGDALFRTCGRTIGDEARATGTQMAEAYMVGVKDESDGFWDGPLTYNRAKARRDTAREMSAAYATGLAGEAGKQADQAQAGRARDIAAAQATAGQARTALTRQHASGLATVEQADTEALRRADDAYAALTAAIAEGRTGGQSMLGGLETALAANILSAAQAQAAEVEHQAALLVSATAQRFGEAVQGLLAIGAQVSAVLQGAPAPDRGALSAGLAEATTQMDAGLAVFEAQVVQARAAGVEQLAQAGQTVVTGIGASTQQGLDAATSGGADLDGTVRDVAGAGEDALGSVEQQHASGLATITAAADSGYGDVVAGVDKAFGDIARSLDLGFAQSAAGLDHGLHGALARMPGEIRTRAEENAARVPPRWKKIVKWALIVAVVVAVALVAGPFVIGAVGAALGTGAIATGVIAGAIVGAATGATIQVINNWEQSRPLSEGVARAALVGGIGGAVGGGFGAYFTAAAQAGTTVVNTAFRQFVADTALNVVTETVINVVATGQFSWEALGMAVVSSVAVGLGMRGAGGLKSVQGVQGRSMGLGESFGGAVRGVGGATVNVGAGAAPAPRRTDVDWNDPNVQRALGIEIDPATGQLRPTGAKLDKPGQLEVDPQQGAFDPAHPNGGPYRGELGQVKGGEYAPEGVFEVTTQPTYAVRVGPPGSWVDHLFATQAEAMAYAQQLAARGSAYIRETSALPTDWPSGGAVGSPGNPVDVVRVLEVPAGTPTIRSVVAPQPVTPGQPQAHAGGGPQTQLPKYIFPRDPAGGPSPSQIAEFPVGGFTMNPPQSRLAQPGGLSATEGTRVTKANGQLGPPAHPLSEHGPDVSLTDIRNQVVVKGKSKATKFTDRARMEQSIADTIDAKAAEIQAWLATNPPAGANKSFDHAPGLGNLGTGFTKNASGGADAIQGLLENVRVVLKSDGNGGYVIQTAFPF
ncbi:RNase A-like domain-containing protein [Actinoplanes sp. NPDC049118]|uniref:RNase A-like domain-containing protein n=1 Tax=Actinoplanes sp. NPDC049118 TaxID=3155769 RepID=UPI0033FFAE65